MLIKTFGITDVGLKREGNEDSFSTEDELGLFIGSNYSFASILESAKSLDLAGIITKLKSMLPSQGF